MSQLKVAVIQQTCSSDTQKNFATSIDAIKQAAASGAKLILLQELHRSLYFCQTEDYTSFDLAESIPGPTSNELQKLSAELDVVIVGSVFEKRTTGLYHNTAVVLDKGQYAGTYRKMHIPDDPGYYEKFYFAPGDLGFKPIETSVGKLGVLVCWDQWYPEAARLMSLAGADMLLYPTAIGWGSQENDTEEKNRQRDAWTIVQRAHAVANGVPVLVANRTGFEHATPGSKQGIEFWGSSFIAGQQGEILAQANINQADILLADITISRNESVRRGWPFLRDRRIDQYMDINKRFID